MPQQPAAVPGAVPLSRTMGDMFDACAKGDLGKMKKLAGKRGVDLFEYDTNGRTLLMVACLTGQEESVRWLLQGDEEYTRKQLSLVNKEGCTALTCAVNEGRTDIVDFLCSKGANVNHSSNLGSTPVMHACFNGHVDTLNALLKYKPLLDARSNDGWTPLHHAAAGGFVNCVQVLLDAGCDPNVHSLKSNKELTPLMCASTWGHTEVVRVLLANKADPNFQNTDGCTALILATAKGNADIVRLLVAMKCSLFIIDKDGLNALEVARKKKQGALVKFLSEQMNADQMQRDKELLEFKQKELAAMEEERRAQERKFEEEAERIKQDYIDKRTREDLVAKLSARRVANRVSSSQKLETLTTQVETAKLATASAEAHLKRNPSTTLPPHAVQPSQTPTAATATASAVMYPPPPPTTTKEEEEEEDDLLSDIASVFFSCNACRSRT